MRTDSTGLLLADRLWIAMALLHRDSPERHDFSKEEIRAKLDESGLAAETNRGSVNAHLKQHLVANVPPSSTGYRMLFETRPGYLRLFRPSDSADPRRRSKIKPERMEIPPRYRPLLDWYEDWTRQDQSRKETNWKDDPLIQLIGSGRHIWADEHADEYIENLRSED